VLQMSTGNTVGNMAGGGIVSSQMGGPQPLGMTPQQQPGGMMGPSPNNMTGTGGMSGGSVLANQLIRSGN